MFIAYVIVTLVTAAYNLTSAILDFVKFPPILEVMTKAGVPHSWLPKLGVLKLAGAIGLLVGFAVPWLGVAAATGLVLFFVAAVIVHMRVRDYTFGQQYVLLALTIVTLVLQLLR